MADLLGDLAESGRREVGARMGAEDVGVGVVPAVRGFALGGLDAELGVDGECNLVDAVAEFSREFEEGEAGFPGLDGGSSMRGSVCDVSDSRLDGDLLGLQFRA